MYTALKSKLASAMQKLDTLKYNDRAELHKLCIALCGRFDITVPKYRTLRGTNRRTQDLSKVIEALYNGITPVAPTSRPIPSVKVSTLRYLFGLRKYKTKSNTDKLVTVIRETYGLGTSVTYLRITEIAGKDFACVAVNALPPEDRPYYFSDSCFDLWASGQHTSIDTVIEYSCKKLDKILN